MERFGFFNDTATTEIYTLSLHDALPIYRRRRAELVSTLEQYLRDRRSVTSTARALFIHPNTLRQRRSEEHTSELQSRQYLVCRLLLEKQKTRISSHYPTPHISSLPYLSL